MTEPNRQSGENEERIIEIEIERLRPFKEHPFQVKDKLKCPIEELELASRQVGRNNLDFHITYENEDEMGGLCKEFERMRGQLAENNQQLKHSGMGMYISRLYCEKHGGQLLIENEKQSGAVITAVFHRIA